MCSEDIYFKLNTFIHEEAVFLLLLFNRYICLAPGFNHARPAIGTTCCVLSVLIGSSEERSCERNLAGFDKTVTLPSWDTRPEAIKSVAEVAISSAVQHHREEKRQPFLFSTCRTPYHSPACRYHHAPRKAIPSLQISWKIKVLLFNVQGSGFRQAPVTAEHF